MEYRTAMGVVQLEDRDANLYLDKYSPSDIKNSHRKRGLPLATSIRSIARAMPTDDSWIRRYA